MGKSFDYFNKVFTEIDIEPVGGMFDFDVGQKCDHYFDNLFMGISLKDNLLYVYYWNTPGRMGFVYKWPWGEMEFEDLANIIDELTLPSDVFSSAFKIIELAKKGATNELPSTEI